LLTCEDLLDEELAAKIGDISTVTLETILHICEDAVIQVIGTPAGRVVLDDQQVAEKVVAWIWDLSRGIHYQSIYGPDMPMTQELVDRLGSQPLDTAMRQTLSDRIDWAFILTEDRIAECIGGRHSIRRPPVRGQDEFPWYDRLKLGYRIRIAMEAHRLISALSKPAANLGRPAPAWPPGSVADLVAGSACHTPSRGARSGCALW
jgi:hypothetical protein